MRAAMGGIDALVGYVGRIQAPVRSKLLAAFLLIELLLVALGAIGLLALREVEQRAGDLASLQHKIDAYRQIIDEFTHYRANLVGKPRIVVFNKIDLIPSCEVYDIPERTFYVSALTGKGIKTLAEYLHT